MRDFVLARRVGGIQQIKTHIDWHTYSELILWPYGYTTADTATGLSLDQRNTFAALGQNMAATNSYTPEQSSDLYIADGTINDWLWGSQGIWSYTFEMYPATSNPGFYPPDEVIPAQTSRNREAVLRFLEYSDCPYKVIGKETQYCGIQSTTIFSDDFETAKGWTVGSAADTATLGRWERGDPGLDELQRRQAARHHRQRRQRPRHRPARRHGGGRPRRRRRPDDDHLAVARAAGQRQPTR